ncbi:MAG: hypothetical protein QOJ42_7763, partial [Acidobacteriaceae bacterium]|nr:hypothetical protein [Acidobacteriaceae bacterium]
MRIKLLGFCLAGCLVALAAWWVHRNNSEVEIAPVTRDVRPQASPNGVAPLAQGAGPQASQAEKIPEKYRETVRKGLEYLVKNQFPDGHWEAAGGKHPVAMTGLVGLALLMEKDGPRRGRRFNATSAKAEYPANVRKAADWLMDKSQPGRDGLLFSEHASESARYMEGHGLATLFLAGVCQGESDAARGKKLTELLTRAVKYIAKAQSSQGGWYHTSRMEGHDFAVISTTAIQIQALQAAENAGIAIPGDAINDALEYLKMAIGEYEKTGPGQKSSRPADTAAALACRLNATSSRFNVNGRVDAEGTKDEL